MAKEKSKKETKEEKKNIFEIPEIDFEGKNRNRKIKQIYFLIMR